MYKINYTYNVEREREIDIEETWRLDVILKGIPNCWGHHNYS